MPADPTRVTPTSTASRRHGAALTALIELAERKASAVMLNMRSAAGVVGAEREKAFAVGAERPQQPARCFSTNRNGNASCPAGTGVCVVNTVVCRISASASSKVEPCSTEVTNALEHDKACVAFVEVKCRGFDPERPQRAHSANAENDFLLHASLAIASVEASREFAVPGSVFFERGVEEVQRDASDLHPPDGGKDRAVAKRNRGHARPAVGGERLNDWRVGPIQALVAFFLPAVGGNGLVQVALRIHETDADQRHAEVAGFLAVIARKDAEPSGVDRQRLVKREFGREVRDGTLEVGKSLRPPGMPRRCALLRARESRV